MLTDYWAHHYFENPKAHEEVEDEDFDQDAIMAEWAGGGGDDWETLS